MVTKGKSELTANKIPEMSIADFRNYIREATEYLHNRNRTIQKLAKEMTKNSESRHNYPFFLDRKDMQSIDTFVKKRINSLSDVTGSIEFSAKITFKNGNAIGYVDLDSMLLVS